MTFPTYSESLNKHASLTKLAPPSIQRKSLTWSCTRRLAGSPGRCSWVCRRRWRWCLPDGCLPCTCHSQWAWCVPRGPAARYPASGLDKWCLERDEGNTDLNIYLMIFLNLCLDDRIFYPLNLLVCVVASYSLLSYMSLHWLICRFNSFHGYNTNTIYYPFHKRQNFLSLKFAWMCFY